jgi:hypothetical protein
LAGTSGWSGSWRSRRALLDAEASSTTVARRLRAQRLTGARFARPEDAVGWLGAVQAQDFGPAKWAVGARVRGATDELVEEAFAAGRILRTHVLRPTWHFVSPADIRWLLTATAPRVQARCAYRYRQLGLDASTLRRGDEALADALRGGAHLTRAGAAAALAAAGIGVEGQRLPYLLMHAELEAIVCSGPRRGKQHTWALLDERAPEAVDLPRNEALGELARRYFTSHGPATARDFATWSSLTLAEVRAAIAAAGPALRSEELAGLVFWMGAGEPGRVPAARSPLVRLVQGYDEYIMGYTETKRVIAPPFAAWSPADRPIANLVVLLDGRVAGYWRRTLKRHRVIVEAVLLEPFGAARMDALEAEAARFGEFVGLAATVVLAPTTSAGP